MYSASAGLRIYHWVIMPNHYHLVLELDEPERLSSVMAGIGRSYACYHHRNYMSAGYLWQGRFKSQPIQKDLYLAACGRYVERNPVSAGMRDAAWDYPYSSARYYVFGDADMVTKESPLFADFGITPQERRTDYRNFLGSFDGQEEALFKNIEFPCGSKEFMRRLIKENGRFYPRRKGRMQVFRA
ncbi:MAG: hypothetical protein A3K83_07530 [Omnitrophica WOR_2 bacterium RBG_13_44_8b]|nr:MAG: hypothetical protein A3K83_07530 [Omnitrophica WOR_2 bacterium RBG_13_44_8b]